MNLVLLILLVWLTTMAFSAILGLTASIYGLLNTSGPITNRSFPYEIEPYSRRAMCYVFIPFVNIFHCTMFLLMVIKYCKK